MTSNVEGHILQRFASLELHGFAGGYGNRLSGPRVAALARGTLGDFELTDAW